MNFTNRADTSSIPQMIQKCGRKFLLALKQKALRVNNSWYRVLSVEKRRFIDAVIQTVDRVLSPLLLKILVNYTQKLLQAIGGIRTLVGNLAYNMQHFGYTLAQKISMIAKRLGNMRASAWANDEGFIRYLTVIDINNLPIFKVSNKQ